MLHISKQYGLYLLILLMSCWSGMAKIQAQEITATLDMGGAQVSTATQSPSPTLNPTYTPIAPPSPTLTSSPINTPTQTISATMVEISPTITSSPTSTVESVLSTPMPTQTPYIIQQIITQAVIVQTAPPIIITQAVPHQQSIAPTKAVTPKPSDIYGWTRFESIALVQVRGRWNLRQNQKASAGAYHKSVDSGATLRLPFEGEGIRLGFLSAEQGGSFQIKLDNELLGVFNTHSNEDPNPYRTQEYFFTPGYHVLDVVATIASDSSQSLSIDYVDVFKGPPMPPTATPSIESTQQEAVLLEYQLVSAPATALPSTTPLPDTKILLEVIIGYDLNTNGQIEPAEGVRGLSIRVVDAQDNRLLASGFTDSSGFARIQTMTSADVVALVPLLGESMQIRRNTAQSTWTIRLNPANVPGLIP